MNLRREPLLALMQENLEKKIDCSRCEGPCCTFVANSMMITPYEAIEAYQSLKSQKLWDSVLRERLKKTIASYRLDQDLGDGKRKMVRRTYTCPLFNLKGFGCPLPFEAKPYGCLGFNPQSPSVRDGENCGSHLSVLELREEMYQEEETQFHLRFFTAFEEKEWWEKKSIPEALLWVDDFAKNMI